MGYSLKIYIYIYIEIKKTFGGSIPWKDGQSLR